MPNRFIALCASLLVVGSSAAYGATTASTADTIHVSVPVLCTLHHQPALTPLGNGYQLGELSEFCNAPGGYEVSVSYAPGSLRGATVIVGDERVILDGSGRTTISRATGPRVRDRTIVAEPGPNGFDTDRLNFDIVAR